jgi:hypothetical protein
MVGDSAAIQIRDCPPRAKCPGVIVREVCRYRLGFLPDLCRRGCDYTVNITQVASSVKQCCGKNQNIQNCEKFSRWVNGYFAQARKADSLSTMAKKKTPETDKRNVLFIRLTDEEETALTNYIQSQLVPPDRTAVAKVALREFFKKVGHWPTTKGDK